MNFTLLDHLKDKTNHNKKILDNIIEIFDNNELKFCYDNDDMYSLIRKSTIVVTDSNPTVIKFALKEKKQIIILTSKEKMTKLEKNHLFQ